MSPPTATDIAFALGVLSLFSKHVPLGLKLFLMALAIFDDIGAIIIITIFYAHSLSWVYVLLSCGVLAVLWLFNHKLRVRHILPYIFLGLLLWLCILHSGVHASVAGVLLSVMIPMQNNTPNDPAPLHYLEEKLHPLVAYLVLPLFAFANAGVSFKGLTWSALSDPIALGIIAALVIGKQLGVFAFAGCMIKLGYAKLPERATWLELYGVALLCGIGFTMSLFIGTLAFQDSSPIHLTQVRLGVLVGSGVSGLIGAILLQIAFLIKRKRGSPFETETE